MKKILAGILSAAAVLSLQMPAFAIDQARAPIKLRILLEIR